MTREETPLLRAVKEVTLKPPRTTACRADTCLVRGRITTEKHKQIYLPLGVWMMLGVKHAGCLRCMLRKHLDGNCRLDVHLLQS